MNRQQSIVDIRRALSRKEAVIGSWMQICHPAIGEIMGSAGFSWVAVDLEHGAFSAPDIQQIFCSLELNNTLPLARLSHLCEAEIKTVLDAGAGGIIVPMVKTAKDVELAKVSSRYPPAGIRGVGFSRANLFGGRFNDYQLEAQAPLLIAMIEHIDAVNNLEEILNVQGLDAIFIGPYDLSASMGLIGEFEHLEFKNTLQKIQSTAQAFNIPTGLHVVSADVEELNLRINEGFQFLAYSIDAVMLRESASSPFGTK